jgi:putative ABC transport system substrate-binding protein
MLSHDTIEDTFDAATKEHAEATVVARSGLTLAHQQVVVDLAARHRLPAIYSGSDFVAAGGLTAFGPDGQEMYSRVANYVDRILKEAKPADLPVEQAAKFELVVNSTTAKALGITIPPEVAAQVTEQ